MQQPRQKTGGKKKKKKKTRRVSICCSSTQILPFQRCWFHRLRSIDCKHARTYFSALGICHLH